MKHSFILGSNIFITKKKKKKPRQWNQIVCSLSVKPDHCFQGKRMSTAVINLYSKHAKNEGA